jgi:hypothetical protein
MKDTVLCTGWGKHFRLPWCEGGASTGCHHHTNTTSPDSFHLTGSESFIKSDYWSSLTSRILHPDVGRKAFDKAFHYRSITGK